MANRLYRSQSDKKIAGVCGGIAEYFNIDPTIVRLLWLILVFCFGGGLVAYLLAVIVIPYRPVQGGDESRYLK
ncbi:MAG: PspC domain-containing protein [Bacteroidales bacterium]|nr:PspC domain-containing protein [Bacteroidales bacterium]MCI5482083.1 PspC domain-containing protein [Bacteroidales bacterium]MDD6751489.1 PspC domain-containing protein [Bacteroidales bacterium]MDY2877845.1 PspC domain-containing protein [Candidatus Cryptobacteroides sp.]